MFWRSVQENNKGNRQNNEQSFSVTISLSFVCFASQKKIPIHLLVTHRAPCTCAFSIVFSSLMFTRRALNPCSSHHISTRWIYKVICGALHGILLMMIRVLCRASQLETVSYTKPPEVHRKIVCPAWGPSHLHIIFFEGSFTIIPIHTPCTLMRKRNIT